MKYLVRSGPIAAMVFAILSYATPQVRLDGEEVQSFAQTYIKEAMATSGVLGVTLAIVQDGEIVLLEGYGFADLARKKPIDPHRTLFRLGSTTKPMTAIAILQLVERGLLDLDTDVNTYLNSKIALPSRSSGPVTLRHLLTHRGGLDADLSFSSLGGSGTSPDMSNDQIKKRLQRVRDQGEIPAYDTLGFGLLSLVLREVTGHRYDKALSESLFNPLGMNHSLAGLPLEMGRLADCAITTGPGLARPCEHPVQAEYIRGSGDVASTALDMSYFMRAILAGGTWNGFSLLSPSGMAAFTDFENFRFHELGPGLGLGIREFYISNRYAYGHGGGISGFNNDMVLFPEHGIGVYIGIAGGSDQVYDARLSTLPRLAASRQIDSKVIAAYDRLESFATAFAEAFIPVSTGLKNRENELSTLGKVDIASLQGLYIHTRYRSNSLMVNLAGQALTCEVKATGPDQITISGVGTYALEAPLYFKRLDSERTVAFRRNNGKYYLAFGGDPYSVYEMVPSYAHPRYTILPVPIFLLILLSSVFYLLPVFSRNRRLAGLLWFGGALLFGISVALELEFATLFLEVRGDILAPFLWRGLWGCSLLLITTAPFIAIKDLKWRGWQSLVFWLHVLLLTLASIYLVTCGLWWVF